MRELFKEKKNISVFVFQNESEIARYAADMVTKEIKKKPDLCLGLATGSSPVPFYRELISEYKKGNVSFSRVRTYNLDEYYPIDPKCSQSFFGFMRENLFDHIDLPEDAIHIPKGNAPDGEEEARRYEQELRGNGGTDIQILGIGSDGHIGFNEPGEDFIYNTHVTALTKETLQDNSRFFDDISEVPEKAITMGMCAIMQAKKILLIANGQNKKDILMKAFYGPITPQVPASILQLHSDVTVIFSEN